MHTHIHDTSYIHVLIIYFIIFGTSPRHNVETGLRRDVIKARHHDRTEEGSVGHTRVVLLRGAERLGC